ncbi:hypothetical protein PchlR47_09630 [Pseudomonas chlororaphis]|nr:hypothetical protein PchlR47_09630 [Pseudomonas chlororaphis]
MFPGRVLVIESHTFQRGVLAKALMSLRIEHVLSAGNAAQAEAYIQRRGVIDVVFLDLNDSSIDHRELLRIAGELGNVRTLVVYSELQLELCRAAIQVKTLFDIKLLGVLDKPLQLTALQKLISRFVRSQIPPSASTWACSMIEHELIPEEQVRHGLVSGAFQAWYQPKFNLCDGQLFGAEVLVRWDHPVRGVLLPKDLLAAVLAYDLIDDMFKQLLDQGLLVLSRLRKQGVEIGLSFNLTASQLVHDDLVEHILHRLEQHRLSGTVLIFEVIENSLLNLPVPAYENLLRLYQAGCGLSIDDFGGGFSSLKLLGQLPFSQLKLDGRFVQDLSDQSNKAMIASSLALAKALSMDLIVEGISSSSALETLITLGCSFGQGFYLAPPMVGSEFCGWLRRYRTDRDVVFAGREKNN